MLSNQVSYVQAVSLVTTFADQVSLLFRGQPGIGKSAIAHAALKHLPDHRLVYIDCAALSIGDIAIPMIDKERGAVRYAINDLIPLHKGQEQPLLIMLDEYTKIAESETGRSLHPLFQEKRLFDRPLPAGSRVIATGNLASDNVGDSLDSLSSNRFAVYTLKNQTFEEWDDNYASAANVHPVVRSTARNYPVFTCYTDLGARERNPYIYDPRHGQTGSFASHRSMEKASHFLHRAVGVLDDDLIGRGLCGIVGEATAAIMLAELRTFTKLPDVQHVLADPQGAPLPANGPAFWQMAFRLESVVRDVKRLDAVLQYAARWESVCEEALVLFSSRVLRMQPAAGTSARYHALCAKYAPLWAPSK